MSDQQYELYAGESKRPGLSRAGLFAWVTMIGVWTLVFLLVWTFIRPMPQAPLHDPNAVARAATPRGDLTAGEEATINIFREASPSVVYITSTELGRDFFGLNVFEIPRGSGSGFVYDRQGHIVTNYHVIEGASRCTVTLADQTDWDAKLVGYEPDKDVAVLKIDAPAEQLTPIVMGTSADLQVGQKVLAIGNPFGFDRTLTVGVVSALGREIQSMNGRKIRGVIQTDAAINPGNSGGPLLDSSGRLIGVNTQIASPSGASAGIGFAVPIDIVSEVVPDLIRYGRVIRPALGVVLFQDWQTRRLRLRGPLIDEVADGSGAAKAGLRGTRLDGRGRILRMGDVIVKVGDANVQTSIDLRDALDLYKAGDAVPVTFIRDERMHTVDVTLQSLR